MQAASHTLLVRLAPRDQMTQFFGLLALSGKVTSFLGPLLVGIVTSITLSQRAGMIHEHIDRKNTLSGAKGKLAPRPHWHMVGHVQRNKIKLILPWTELVHSVDSLRLAEDLHQHGERLGRVVDILLQVNTSGAEQVRRSRRSADAERGAPRAAGSRRALEWPTAQQPGTSMPNRNPPPATMRYIAAREAGPPTCWRSPKARCRSRRRAKS